MRKENMYNILVIVAIALLVAPHPLLAKDYVVGDNDGWTNRNVNYTAWAEKYQFSVGDTIVFNYDPERHDVCEVKKDAYDECNHGESIKCLRSGNDRIDLESPGPRYFLCDVGFHCDDGQKVSISVKAKP